MAHRINIGFGVTPLTLQTSPGKFWTAGLGTPGGSQGSGFNPVPGVTFTGNFADGQTMTINLLGGGLGARINPLPLVYYPFETDFSTHPTLSRTANTMIGSTPNTKIQSTIMPANAAGSVAYIPVSGVNPKSSAFSANGSTGQPLCDLNSTGAGFTMYSFQKRYYGFASNPNNDKMFRIWEIPSSGGYPNCYFGFLSVSGHIGNVENDQGTDRANLGGGGVVGGNSNNCGPMPGPEINTWHTDEFYGREATVDTIDGIWNWARQGSFAYALAGRWTMNSTTVLGVSGQSQNNNCFRGCFLDEVTNSPPDGISDTGYTGITVVDDSWLQLIITDEAGTYSWGQSGTPQAVVASREWQPQLSRSDTSIKFKVRQGSHTSLVGKSLIAITGYGTSVNLGVGF